MIMKLSKLIGYYELAKNTGNKLLANKIFIYIWQATKDKDLFTYEIETYSLSGAVHFDLFVLVLKENTEIRLNIPMPLLGWKIGYCLVKEFPCVPRREHARITHNASEEEKELLNKFESAHGKKIESCVNNLNIIL